MSNYSEANHTIQERDHWHGPQGEGSKDKDIKVRRIPGSGMIDMAVEYLEEGPKGIWKRHSFSMSRKAAGELLLTLDLLLSESPEDE